MQSWAKRGIQTALVTGGLLMLGTGIASAESAHPDQPAGPLDLGVTVPVDIAENAVGTPLGQLDLPGGKGELNAKAVTEPVNVLAKELDANPVQTQLGTPGGAGMGFTPENHVLRGNKVTGDLVVPVQAVGNAIAAGGKAKVNSEGHEQTWSHNQDVKTNGDHDSIAGNIVDLDWALPVQLAGNAAGVAGAAESKGNATQSVRETGNDVTSGNDSALAGNVVSPQFATPIQVTGNAISYLLGNAHSDFDASTDAAAGGYLKSAGDHGAASGNIAGAPLALPVKLNGNAASAWGSNAHAASDSVADAAAGGTTPGFAGIPSYATTSGNESLLDGTIAETPVSTVVNADGNAISWIGNATTGGALDGYAAKGSSSSTLTSGGFASTQGKNAGASSNVVNTPIALPVELFGSGVNYIGNTHAKHESTTNAVAGDGTYTMSDGSLLGGNLADVPVASTAEVFGVGANHIGNSSAVATEDKYIKAGNYSGTTTKDSGGSGNAVTVPVGVPAEVFGTGATFIGQATGVSAEKKEVHAGGGVSTADPNSAVSSNLVAAPVALPAQVFGDGATVIGRAIGQANNDTIATAGGDYTAEGKNSGGSGNIVHTPISLPTQADGLGVAGAGLASGASDNMTDSKAGGKVKTTGEDGGLAGNVVGVPLGGTANAFGDGAVLGGLANGQTNSDVSSVAGGSTKTNGKNGGLAGNIVDVPALPIVDAFGVGAGALGKGTGVSASNTDAKSGGAVDTSGVNGGFSGDIVSVPLAAVPQAWADGVGALGVGNGVGENVTRGAVGGPSNTDGKDGFSGIDGQLPLGAMAQVWNVPVELLGKASAVGTNDTQIKRAPQIDLPVNGSELGADSLPSLSGVGTERADLPVTNPLAGLNPGQFTGLLGGLGG